MEKKWDPSYFDCGMVVGAKQGGLSISETVDLFDFYRRKNLHKYV